MTKKENVPLHKVIKDFAFSFQGYSLQSYRLPNSESVHIALRKPDFRHGLFVNFENESASYRGSQAEHIVWGGIEKVYTPYDDCEPTGYKVIFEDWVREHLMRVIEYDLGHILGIFFEKVDIWSDEGKKQMSILCEEIAQLPFVKFPTSFSLQPTLRIFSLLHEIEKSQTISKEQEQEIIEYIQAEKTYSQQEQWETWVVSYGFHFLPTSIPKDFSNFLLLQIQESFRSFHKERSISTLFRIANRYAKQVPIVKKIFHKYALDVVKSAVECHTIAGAFSKSPSESVLYVEKGLQIEPDNMSLLVFGESVYLELEDEEKFDQIQEKLAKIDGLTDYSLNDIQTMIDRYTHLANDFRYHKPKTDGNRTGPELVQLEDKLNKYWLSQLPPKTSLARDTMERTLCEQNRFLSSGSANYVAWLRNQHRYQEVVDFMMPLKEELELCALRHKTGSIYFSYFVGNGLSSFLDSQDPKHIEQAIELIDAWETVISWTHGHSLYALGCVASRAGQTKRALNYIERAVEGGQSIWYMMRDLDLKNIWRHPRFIALQG